MNQTVNGRATETLPAALLLADMEMVITGIIYPIRRVVDGGTTDPVRGVHVPAGYIEIELRNGTWMRLADTDPVDVFADWVDTIGTRPAPAMLALDAAIVPVLCRITVTDVVTGEVIEEDSRHITPRDYGADTLASAIDKMTGQSAKDFPAYRLSIRAL